jgi:hypothetical protein
VLFLIKNGKIEFVRAVQSGDEGIGDADIQSINVTVNYCKQVLKTSPSNIYLIGNLGQQFHATAEIDIPIACPLMPANVKAQNEVYLDLVYAISAVKAKKDIDISQKDYKSFYNTWKLLKYSAATFAVLFVVGLLYSGYLGFNTLSAKGKLKSLKQEIASFDADTLAQYKKRKSAFKSYKGFVDANKKTARMPVVKNFLTSFSDANTENVSIGAIRMIIKGDTLKTTIDGMVNETPGDEKGGFQKYTYYQEFIDSVIGLKDITVKKHVLTPKERNFKIELESK